MDKDQTKKEVAQLVGQYLQDLKEGKIVGNRLNEENTKSWIDDLFRILGWNIREDVTKEEATGRKKRVDYAFRIDGSTQFLLEAKGLDEDLNNYIDQALNYGYLRDVTWVILTNFKEVRVYNSKYLDKEEQIRRLFTPITIQEFVSRFDDLWLLSKSAFIEGLIYKEAVKFGKVKPKEPVTELLSNDLMNWRSALTASINAYSDENKLPKNQEEAKKLIDENVQKILDRILFIRVAEDRRVEKENRLMALLNSWDEEKPLSPILKKLFREMDETYDSGLFHPHQSEDLKLNDAVLANVIRETYVNKGNISYDFKVIPADVLGAIYEQYLGSVLTKTAKRARIEAKADYRKEHGIYYTPTNVVEYIVKNTIGVAIKNKKVHDIEKIRILDLACGSGSFLLKAFDIIDAYYQQNDRAYGQSQLDSIDRLTTKTKIIRNNIHGVDLDEKAVEITQLNLLLKIAETRHRLPELNKNIRLGNSLIDDENVAKESAFGWRSEFKEIFDGGGFDIIIGNPPYDVIYSNENPAEYDFYKSKKGYVVAEYNPNLFALFIEKALSLLKDGGILGFIVPNSIINNKYFSNLRKLILDNTMIIQIYDLKKDIFKSANVDTCIIILKKEADDKVRLKNKLAFSFGKSSSERLEIEKERKIPQEVFLNSAFYSFNVVEDENFGIIKKTIEEDTIPLGDIAEVYRGMVTRNNKECIFDSPKNSKYKPLISGRDIGRYWLKFNNRYIYFDKSSIGGGCWDERVYLSEQKLLVQLIRNLKLPRRLIVAYDNKKYYVLQNLNNIIINENSGYYTKYILGIINSNLINYWFRKLFVDINIKRIYLKQIPIKKDKTKQNQVIKLVEKMISYNSQLIESQEKTNKTIVLEEEIEKTDREINDFVYNIYGITGEEKKRIEESLK